MDIWENDVILTYKYLPKPFKEYNEVEGKMMYDEIMTAQIFPEGINKRDKNPRSFKSILIYHLSDNTKELVKWVEDNRSFLFRSGHMSLQDQQLIVEILFYHAF